MNWKSYSGPLNQAKMSDKDRKAYEIFNSMKKRCKAYGFPPPEMGPREFIGWWDHNLSLKSWIRPTVGRKDHSKGYLWNNFEMQEMAENSREGILRNKTNLKMAIKNHKKVYVYCKKSGELIAIIDGIRPAAELFGVSQRQIQFMVRGKYKKSSKINFILRDK